MILPIFGSLAGGFSGWGWGLLRRSLDLVLTMVFFCCFRWSRRARLINAVIAISIPTFILFCRLFRRLSFHISCEYPLSCYFLIGLCYWSYGGVLYLWVVLSWLLLPCCWLVIHFMGCCCCCWGVMRIVMVRCLSLLHKLIWVASMIWFLF
jgi:hypothetical protein